jgi:hypothetical protein
MDARELRGRAAPWRGAQGRNSQPATQLGGTVIAGIGISGSASTIMIEIIIIIIIFIIIIIISIKLSHDDAHALKPPPDDTRGGTRSPNFLLGGKRIMSLPRCTETFWLPFLLSVLAWFS